MTVSLLDAWNARLAPGSGELNRNPYGRGFWKNRVHSATVLVCAARAFSVPVCPKRSWPFPTL